MRYRVFVLSHSSHEREYETSTRSAMVAAKEYGRCEGGEQITVTTKSGRVLSQVRWSPENGGHYWRVPAWNVPEAFSCARVANADQLDNGED